MIITILNFLYKNFEMTIISILKKNNKIINKIQIILQYQKFKNTNQIIIKIDKNNLAIVFERTKKKK